MDYLDALKQVKAAKPGDNYLLVKLSYSNQLILPYKDGLAFMASLVNAEQLEENYNKPPKVHGLDQNMITVRILSRQEYEQYKIAGLLDITLDAVKETASPHYLERTP